MVMIRKSTSDCLLDVELRLVTVCYEAIPVHIYQFPSRCEENYGCHCITSTGSLAR